MQSHPYELRIHSNRLLIPWVALSLSLLLLLLCVYAFLLFLLLLGLCIFMNKWQQYSPLSNCSHCIILNNVTQSEIYKCFIRKFKPGPVLSLHSLIRSISLLFSCSRFALWPYQEPQSNSRDQTMAFFFSFSFASSHFAIANIFVHAISKMQLALFRSFFFVGLNFRMEVRAKKKTKRLDLIF